jgi:hypothetical protein
MHITCDVSTDRCDSSKCRSGTQERELGVQLVTFSAAFFLMWYYFAVFSTKTFECLVSRPMFFVSTTIAAGLSSLTVYTHVYVSEFFVKRVLICGRTHDLFTKSYDVILWNVLTQSVHRKVLHVLHVSFSSISVLTVIVLRCFDLICAIGLCVYIYICSFQADNHKPFPTYSKANTSWSYKLLYRVLTIQRSFGASCWYSAARVGGRPRQLC